MAAKNRHRILLGAWLWLVPLFSFFLSLGSSTVKAQELSATVSINTQQIEASFRPRFETLRTELEEFINGQQWTSNQFARNERIQCTFALTINEIVATDVYRASITIQARRPVYNTSYQTIIINWRDDEATLPYQEGQNLNFNEFALDNEMIALVAYYSYLVLALDYESFAPRGGETYLRKCENIVSQMQTAEGRGWKAFDTKTNRHALITALLEQGQQGYRTLWYNYHRLGLDAMAQAVDKGRKQITDVLPLLKEVRSSDPMTPLLSLFVSAKQDELKNVYEKQSRQEQKNIADLLSDIFPTYNWEFKEK